MRLTEVRKGIYSFNGLNLDNPNRLIVAMHPFSKEPLGAKGLEEQLTYALAEFEESMQDKGLDYCFKSVYADLIQDYLLASGIEDLIIGHDGPVIVFEESNKYRDLRFSNSVRLIRKSGRVNDIYLIKTHGPDSELKKIDWSDAVMFIDEFAGPAGLIGGLVWNKLYNKPGCLGAVCEELDKHGITYELLPGLTF